jgi:hypothetical protein
MALERIAVQQEKVQTVRRESDATRRPIDVCRLDQVGACVDLQLASVLNPRKEIARTHREQIELGVAYILGV